MSAGVYVCVSVLLECKWVCSLYAGVHVNVSVLFECDWLCMQVFM